MEQGNRLDSTPVSAAQAVLDDAREDLTLDAAVSALLTRPAPAPAPRPADDYELLQLGVQFDAAHATWRDASSANREPTERFCDFIEAAKATGGPTIKELEAAWALPGVLEAHRRDDEAFSIVADDLGPKIFRTPANTVAGLAVQARAAIPLVWVMGNYEEDANLGDSEDLPQKSMRSLIESVLRLADVDWRGQPLARAFSAPAIPTVTDLATACVDQIKRLEQWDENPDAFSEKQGDDEMDRWAAVFRRAIDEPSTSLRDLAGKAFLMLADLDRFEPEEADDKDNDRLMRVIMREAIAMGGLAYPAAALNTRQDEAVVERAADAPTPDPILALIERHRRAYAEWLPHLEITAPLQMGSPESIRAEAEADGPCARAGETFDSLLTARPSTLAGLVAWASYLPKALREMGRDDSDAAGDQGLSSICDAVLSLVPLVAPHAAEHTDAALIALGSELEAADARAKAVDADLDERAALASAAMPEQPDCLTFREADHPFNLRRIHCHPSALDGSAVRHDDIEWMTRRRATHQIKRPVRPGERAWHDFPGHVLDVVPWPEAQARIDEIVAAWDAWHAARAGVDEEHGVPEAESRSNVAAEEVKAILDRMAALPALTVEGMHVKLRAFQDAVPHMGGANWGDLMLRSLMRDARATIPETEA